MAGMDLSSIMNLFGGGGSQNAGASTAATAPSAWGGGGFGGGGGGNLGWVSMMMKGLGKAANEWAQFFPPKTEITSHTLFPKVQNRINFLQDQLDPNLTKALKSLDEYKANVAANTPALAALTGRTVSGLEGLTGDQRYDPLAVYNSLLSGTLNTLQPSAEQILLGQLNRRNLMAGRPVGTGSSFDNAYRGNLTANLLAAILNTLPSNYNNVMAARQAQYGNLANLVPTASGWYSALEQRPMWGVDAANQILANQGALIGQDLGLNQGNTAFTAVEKQDPWAVALKATGAALSQG